MAVTVVIPTTLRLFTEHRSEIELEGKTVGEVLTLLSEEYPDYYTRDERKNLAEGAEIYLIDKSLCTLTFRRPRSEESRNKARQRAKKNGFGNN